MKRTLLMIGSFLLVSFFLVAASSVAATSFSATLSGGEEAPPVDTMAVGDATFELSEDGTQITFKVNVTGITGVRAAHIHLGARGTTGPVVADLAPEPRPGTFTGILTEGTITEDSLRGPLLGKPFSALIDEIKAGNTYVNVHTMAHPAGEIRGQIQ